MSKKQPKAVAAPPALNLVKMACDVEGLVAIGQATGNVGVASWVGSVAMTTTQLCAEMLGDGDEFDPPLAATRCMQIASVVRALHRSPLDIFGDEWTWDHETFTVLLGLVTLLQKWHSAGVWCISALEQELVANSTQQWRIGSLERGSAHVVSVSFASQVLHAIWRGFDEADEARNRLRMPIQFAVESIPPKWSNVVAEVSKLPLVNPLPYLDGIVAEADRLWPRVSNRGRGASRVNVDLEAKKIEIDGTPYPLTDVQALYLDCVIQGNGVYVSLNEAAEKHPILSGTRARDIKRGLPEEVLAAFESGRSKGTRLRSEFVA